jgi:ribonuclease III
LLSFLKKLNNFLTRNSSKDTKLVSAITNIIGQSPYNIELYKMAICHSSVAKESESNERLEYLGDAILGTVIAEYLFKKFPYKSEGFLTEIRSRIVNRESLNKLGKKIGLNKLVEYNSVRGNNFSHKSLHGDALEALIGAVYLDKGFKSCRRFILTRLVNPHFDIEEIVENNSNFKSMLIEWAQKENKNIKFLIIKELGNVHNKEFTAQVLLDDKAYSSGTGPSKKKAEQAAAEKACQTLGLK